MGNPTETPKRFKTKKVDKDWTVCDPRIQELVASPYFPKDCITTIIHFFSPHILKHTINNALSASSISEAKLLEVVQAIKFVIDTRKESELSQAKALIEKGEKLKEQISEGGGAE